MLLLLVLILLQLAAAAPSKGSSPAPFCMLVHAWRCNPVANRPSSVRIELDTRLLRLLPVQLRSEGSGRALKVTRGARNKQHLTKPATRTIQMGDDAGRPCPARDLRGNHKAGFAPLLCVRNGGRYSMMRAFYARCLKFPDVLTPSEPDHSMFVRCTRRMLQRTTYKLRHLHGVAPRQGRHTGHRVVT